MSLVGLGGLGTLVLAVTVCTLGEMVQWPVAATYLTTLAPAHHRGRHAGLHSLAYGTALPIVPAAGTTIYIWHPTAGWPAGALLIPDLHPLPTPTITGRRGACNKFGVFGVLWLVLLGARPAVAEGVRERVQRGFPPHRPPCLSLTGRVQGPGDQVETL
jgi:MFS family permease